MKNTLKLLLAASIVALTALSCNKPSENTDTDGKDSIETTVDTTTTAPDTTVQAPADTTAAKQ
jgi:hypothetical protein